MGTRPAPNPGTVLGDSRGFADGSTERAEQDLLALIRSEMERRKSGHVRICVSWEQRGERPRVTFARIVEEPIAHVSVGESNERGTP